MKIVSIMLTLLIMSHGQQFAYPCDVEGCQQCSYYNFCGQCQNNHLLTINTQTNAPFCAVIQCNVDNCESCLNTNYCYKCQDGFHVNPEGVCADDNRQCSTSFCSHCSKKDVCQVCQFGYNLQELNDNKTNYCVSDVKLTPNCVLGFYTDMCRVCEEGYLVGVGYMCVEKPSFGCEGLSEGCMQCNANNNCSMCLEGYKLMDGNCQKLECSIESCVECSDDETCSECAQNYQLRNNACIRKVYGCNIMNCQSCASSPQICTSCSAGYLPQQLKDQMGVVVSVKCQQMTQAQGTNSALVQNCQQLDYILTGTDSELYIGCINCMENYINVGGFCVANLTQKNFLCEVENCVSCIQNNYCGRCKDGYYVQLFTGGQCFKNYSPLPNCQLTTIFLSDCLICDEGYVNDFGVGCIKINPNVGCEVEGCKYCLQDNVCDECRQGFSFSNSSNTTCSPLCSVNDCFQCLDDTKCQICNFQYVLTDDGECILATDAMANCTATYGDGCSQCNAKNCTKCETGLVLDETNNFCCPPPTQNYMGCLKYSGVCTSTCIQCQKGYFLVSNQCFKFPCSIDNCAYCFRSQACIVCQEGYTFKDGACTQFTASSSCPENCVACDDAGACSECINGYEPYHGRCVCGFQNCLLCQGSAFCTLCAFPNIGTIVNAGCSPQIDAFVLCEVDNCLNCMSVNRCAECAPGFTLLANGTCSKIDCDNNCVYCDEADNVCFQCEVGRIPNDFLGNECVELSDNYACEVEGCGICETSTTCQLCLQTYELTANKTCQRITCVDNCLLCLESTTCFVCDITYYLNTDNKCVETSVTSRDCTQIEKCIVCDQSNSTLFCEFCDIGFQPTSDYTSCVPQDCSIPNCQICLPVTIPSSRPQHPLCLFCKEGYHLNSYQQCVLYTPQLQTLTCNVYNCLYCDQSDECALCASGWLATGTLCETSIYCDVQNCATCTQPTFCTSCDSSYELSLGSCVPQCDILNCVTCATLSTCQTCSITFVVSDDKKSCVCPDTFTESNNRCVCPDGQLEFEGKCVECTIDSCASCSEANVCAQCNENFVLGDNKCTCPETFVLQNNQCSCSEGEKPFNNTCIECDIKFCDACNEINTCFTCVDTFQLNNDTCECPDDFTQFLNKCYDCEEAQYCTTCTDTNFCGQCFDTFTVINGQCVCPSTTNLFNQSCVPCQIKNCDLCQTDNVCTTCATKSTKVNGVCLTCTIDNCVSCTSENVCGQCSSNLALSADGSSCVTCTNDNCALCSSNDVCAVCQGGFSFNQDGNACVNCTTVNGCEKCSSDNVCAKCLSGFTLSSGQCSVCGYPCETCNSDGKCATCQLPFSSNADSNGNCFTCNVANCVTCSASNKNQCTSCVSPYSVNSNTKECQILCSTNLCLKCDDVSVCEVCVDGYAPNGNGCLKCDQAPQCLACQSDATSVCTSCADGYQLDSGKCKACDESNCASCPTNTDECEKYKVSTGQIAFENNIGEIIPVVCNAGCLSCSSSNPNTCLNCIDGYSLQNGYCVPCASSCKSCKDGSPSACLSCYSNAFLSDESCIACTSSSNCLTCLESNKASCTSCPYGYSLNSNNVCDKGCPDNCLSCVSSSVCQVCIEGYSVNSAGSCLPCLANCRECSGQEPGVCLSCGDGFFLTTQNSCKACAQFCTTCSANGCSECMGGYVLTSTFTCAQKCKTPCATCSQADPSKCFSCLGGYDYDQTTSACMPRTTCINNVCTVCPFGYTLNVNECFECNQNCGRCSLTNKDTCTSCLDGFYLRTSDSTCVSCPSQCSTCTTATNCLTCAAGYTIQQSPVSSVVNCVQCQSPCESCRGNSQTCTSCASGFRLQGWKCVSIFNFGLTIVLNTNLSSFYSNYLAFLQAIAQGLGSTNINVVTVFGLAQGSVNFTGNGTTTQSSNSDGSLSQFNNLSNTLSSGNSIAGMDITSSQIDVNGGQVPQESSGPNLALILGISIPLALILIGGILFFLCRNKNTTSYAAKDETTVRQEFQLSNQT